MTSTDLIIGIAFSLILLFTVYLLAGRTTIEYLHGTHVAVQHDKQCNGADKSGGRTCKAMRYLAVDERRLTHQYAQVLKRVEQSE